MILVSTCRWLCPIQVLSREWSCSWCSAYRWCSNYICMINNLIAYYGATYIRGFTVGTIMVHWLNEGHTEITMKSAAYFQWKTRVAFIAESLVENWNGNVLICIKFLSLAASELVKMTTCSAYSDKNAYEMAFHFSEWKFQMAFWHFLFAHRFTGSWVEKVVSASSLHCFSPYIICSQGNITIITMARWQTHVLSKLL